MQQLRGSLGNGGNVYRDGDRVVRPMRPHTNALTTLLEALTDAGFPAPVPLGRTADGSEAFAWIDGDVGVPPFPAWVLSDEALSEAARMLRRYHEVAADLELPADLEWSSEMADPQGGPIICHNDICPENVVYRDGQAVAFLDFDFAAPGRPLWDLAQTARMWCPLRPADLRVAAMAELDALHRLGVLSRSYGLPASEHEAFVDTILASGRVGMEFVSRRLAAAEPAFVAAWAPLGGDAAAAEIFAWITEQQGAMLEALDAGA